MTSAETLTRHVTEITRNTGYYVSQSVTPKSRQHGFYGCSDPTHAQQTSRSIKGKRRWEHLLIHTYIMVMSSNFIPQQIVRTFESSSLHRHQHPPDAVKPSPNVHVYAEITQQARGGLPRFVRRSSAQCRVTTSHQITSYPSTGILSCHICNEHSITYSM